MMRTCLVLAALCLVGKVAGAQVQPPVFRADADAVSVNVSVKKGNTPVQGLTAADFRLYDNDVLQELATVSIDAVPVDVSFVLNNMWLSASNVQTLRAAVQGMTAFLRPSDRYRVLTMGNAITNAIPWQVAGTPDTGAISTVYGAVALVGDAVVMALLHRTPSDRRHLVVALTDGVDACSVSTGDSVKKAAERSGSVFHWVNVQRPRLPAIVFDPSTRAVPGTPLHPGVRAYCRGFESSGHMGDLAPALSDAVRLTGGTSQTAWYKADRIAVEAFDKIFDDFRRSYVLHYVPQGVERIGWHRLRVDMATKGYTVRARTGYWANNDQVPPTGSGAPSR
jgi:hypothetical protein